MKAAHVINIFTPDYNSDLFTAQPLTIESMRRAKAFAGDVIDVSLFSSHFAEDVPIVPPDFNATPLLTRAVTDVATFTSKRKLPLIADILDALYKATDAEYLIYTNNDIIVQPHFYVYVSRMIEEGYDAFIINRRRIDAGFESIKDLPLIHAAIGKKHPGFDCFVFKRDLLPKMKLGHICIGVPFIGVTLAHNLFCYARRFKLIDDMHLSSHIGMDVMGLRNAYYWHNRRQFNTIIKELRPYLDIRKFPYADKSFFMRYYKWGMNPSLFVFMNLKLELKLMWQHLRRGKNRFF